MNNSILESRVYRAFGIFMIFVYAALGIGMLFFWHEINNHTIIGTVLLIWAAFRIYMLIRHRRQANQNENS